MTVDLLLNQALKFDFLSIEEGVFLFENAPTAELALWRTSLERLKKRIQIKLRGRLTVTLTPRTYA